MLSISAMANGQENYYLNLAREDYYLAGGEPPGIWHGKGASDLGLSGQVQGEALTQLLKGFHPHDGRALIQNAGDNNHQPGWDLTFSAPKSVSVAWSQATSDTQRLIQQAHAAAVRAALSYIEQAASITRRGKNGVELKQAHLIVATFEHGTSRAQDCQLHTHALLINVCTTEGDGQTRTLLSHPVYKAKMTAGAVYRAELAHQLEQSLGWSIERKGQNFEVAGVSQELSRVFSTRRREIEAALTSFNSDSAAAAAAATHSTRRAKLHVPREQLFRQWRQTGQAHGWSTLDAEALSRPLPKRDPRFETAEALQSATERVTAQQSFFSEQSFVRALAEESPGRGLGAAALLEAAARHLDKNPEIVSLGRRGGQRLFTTREMLQLEEELLASVERSRSQATPGVSEKTTDAVITSRGEKLSDEQA